jgi:hypothetical protein
VLIILNDRNLQITIEKGGKKSDLVHSVRRKSLIQTKIKDGLLNPLAPDFFLQILAHPVFKM